MVDYHLSYGGPDGVRSVSDFNWFITVFPEAKIAGTKQAAA